MSYKKFLEIKLDYVFADLEDFVTNKKSKDSLCAEIRMYLQRTGIVNMQLVIDIIANQLKCVISDSVTEHFEQKEN